MASGRGLSTSLRKVPEPGIEPGTSAQKSHRLSRCATTVLPAWVLELGPVQLQPSVRGFF